MNERTLKFVIDIWLFLSLVFLMSSRSVCVFVHEALEGNSCFISIYIELSFASTFATFQAIHFIPHIRQCDCGKQSTNVFVGLFKRLYSSYGLCFCRRLFLWLTLCSQNIIRTLFSSYCITDVHSWSLMFQSMDNLYILFTRPCVY